ncbi:hypothetical protein MMPV_000526 [Pyropia vietnamensis]
MGSGAMTGGGSGGATPLHPGVPRGEAVAFAAAVTVLVALVTGVTLTLLALDPMDPANLGVAATAALAGGGDGSGSGGFGTSAIHGVAFGALVGMLAACYAAVWRSDPGGRSTGRPTAPT